MQQRFYSFTIIILYLLCFGIIVRAQTPAAKCPAITVTCPYSAEYGEPMTFTANVSGADSNIRLTYKWTVSAGKIISGQDASSITIDTTGLERGGITATVEVEGFDSACSNKASCSVSPGVRPRDRLFDTYGNIPFNAEKARLDNLAIQLQNEPGAQGYIIAYAGRRARVGQAKARLTRAKNYLIEPHGIRADRLVLIDGGHRENLEVELWIIPTGATPPTASPTVQPSEVQIIKAR
jgi:hypothetical protein